ncbi:MAG: hypothetical protein DRM97_05390, partial [Thermoprotei archaeon]
MEEPPCKEEALLLLHKVTSIERFHELSKVAVKVREEECGDIFKLDGFIGPITECETDPPCRYCSRASVNTIFRKPLSENEIRMAVEVLRDETSVHRVELGGGTVWS